MAAPVTASMPSMAMLKSGLVTAAVAAGSFALVGKPAGSMFGANEYVEVFIGLGLASVVGPMVLAAVDKMQMPPMPSLGMDTAKSALYGGALGTAVYWGINMIYPDLSDVTDVAISALVAGAVGPYLAFPM